MEVEIEYDLRHMFGAARDQGARPTCLAFAASDAHAAIRPDWEPLSCEYAYFHALQRDGGQPGDGATLAGMLTAIREDGQPPEAAWAYLACVPANVALWTPPTNAGPIYRRDSANGRGSIDDITSRLDAGSPVVITIYLSQAFYRPDANGIVAVREAPDQARRHAVIAVGHGVQDTRRMILVRNSWGKTWGIDGHAWLSDEYLTPRLYGIAELKGDLTNVSADRNARNMRSGVA